VDIRPEGPLYSCRMPSRDSEKERAALLQGTLDLLIMRTLLLGPRHGQGIARSIQQQSEDVFLVDHGSLYLALQRLEAKDYVRGDWGVSENNRRARFYKLTQGHFSNSDTRRNGGVKNVLAQETFARRF
jgi:PadR family transcriptional regulator, regulatory protein PadR